MPARACQKGFSLPEVLIAALIAAGMMAASALMLGGSARLARASAERSDMLIEAQAIAARIRSGMSDEGALAGSGGWRIERAALPSERAGEKPFFDRVTLTTTEGPGFSFEIIAKAAEGDGD